MKEKRYGKKKHEKGLTLSELKDALTGVIGSYNATIMIEIIEDIEELQRQLAIADLVGLAFLAHMEHGGGVKSMASLKTAAQVWQEDYSKRI